MKSTPGFIMKMGIYRLAQGVAWVSGASVVLIMFLTAADVFMRYLGYPIKGAMEITEMGLVVLGFLAFGYVQLKHVNVTIEILISRLSKHTRAILAIITAFLSLVVFGFMSWALTMQAWKFVLAPDIAPRGDILHTPHVPFMFVAAVGVFALFLVLVVNFLQSLTDVTGEKRNR